MSGAPSSNEEAIAVAPPFLVGDIEPGTRRSFTVRVLNQTRRAFRFTTTFQDLESAPQAEGGRRFLEPGESDWGAAKWMQVEPPTWTLGPATTQELTVTADVPAGIGAGGRYAALLIRALPVVEPNDPGNLSITNEISVFALLTVPGHGLHDLRVDVLPPSSPRWRGGRAAWTVRVRNRGDIHENVSGSLRVGGLFGGAERHRLEPFILLPGGEHVERVRLDLRDAPDLWSARARVDTGDGHPDRVLAPRVLVLPWWLLLVLAVAAALIAWRLGRRRRHRQVHDEQDAWDDGEQGDVADAFDRA